MEQLLSFPLIGRLCDKALAKGVAKQLDHWIRRKSDLVTGTPLGRKQQGLQRKFSAVPKFTIHPHAR